MIFETIIFAAGPGSRLGEFGEKIPKALLPVWREDGYLEPILIKLMKQSVNAGTSKISISSNHCLDDIKNCLDVYSNQFSVPINLIFQKELDGEATGLFYLENINHPILALDGDNYLTNNDFFSELIHSFETNKECLATIGITEVPDINRYANVKVSDDLRLLDIIEKPDIGMEFGNMAKMGCYFLSEKLIQRGKPLFKDSQGYLATTAAFSNICRNNEIAYCVEYTGEYLDIGTLDAYVSHLKNFKPIKI